MKLLKYLLSSLFLVGLIGLIEYQIGWQTLFTPWSKLNALQITAALVLALASYAVRALRMYLYFLQELKTFFPSVFRLQLQHNFYNNLLPMRTGEISFPLLMQHYFQVKPATSVGALLWFRLLDLSLLLLIGAVAFVALQFSPWLCLVIIGGYVIGLWLLFLSQRHVLALIIERTPRKLAALLQQLEAGMPKDAGHYLQVIVLTLLNWVVKMGVFVWILLQFSEQLPLWHGTLAVVGAELTSVTPLHGFAGAGTFEAGMIAVLQPLGWSMDAVLLAAVNLHLFVLGASLLGFCLSWLLPIPKNQNPSLK